MAQRSSRSKKARGRSTGNTNPELRASRSAQERAERTQRRQREDRESGHGPKVRVRPEGRSGLLALNIGAWLVAGLTIAVGKLLGQWGAFSYPDSLWLYVAIATAITALAVGYVARDRRDVNYWAVQGGVVALGALVAEAVFGPSCPGNGDCGVIGARGAFGIGPSIGIAILCAVTAWVLGHRVFWWAEGRRPRSGRIGVSHMLWGMLVMGVAAGVPLAATLTGIDSYVRNEPNLGRLAQEKVATYCYDFGDAEPDLAVRADPVGKQPSWSSFLVHRVDEKRPGIKGHKLPKTLATAEAPTPYEAAVSFDADGEPIDLVCRKVAPRDGNAEAADFAAPTYGATENMLDDRPSTYLGSNDNGGLQAPGSKPGAGGQTINVG